MGRPKVLVVEDDLVVRRMIVRILSSFCDTVDVPGGTEALAVLRSGQCPDLVVSDVDMPSVDGLSLLRSALEEGLMPKSAFLFMSGSLDGDRRTFFADRDIPLFRKPFDQRSFIDAVESLLSARVLTRLRHVATIGA